MSRASHGPDGPANNLNVYFSMQGHIKIARQNETRDNISGVGGDGLPVTDGLQLYYDAEDATVDGTGKITGLPAKPEAAFTPTLGAANGESDGMEIGPNGGVTQFGETEFDFSVPRLQRTDNDDGLSDFYALMNAGTGGGMTMFNVVALDDNFATTTGRGVGALGNYASHTNDDTKAVNFHGNGDGIEWYVRGTKNGSARGSRIGSVIGPKRNTGLFCLAHSVGHSNNSPAIAYVDGVEVDSGQNSETINNVDRVSMHIGLRVLSRGEHKALLVYNRVLTPQEVADVSAYLLT